MIVLFGCAMRELGRTVADLDLEKDGALVRVDVPVLEPTLEFN